MAKPTVGATRNPEIIRALARRAMPECGPGLIPQPHFFLAHRTLSQSCLTSPSLGFFICKMGMAGPFPCGLLLGLPGAGTARLAVSLSPRRLSPPLARALPSPLPERGGQMSSLGEKNVSARTIPFSPPAAHGGPGLAPFSLALPRAPRLSRPAFPSQQPLRAPSVAIIHGPPGDRR